MPSYGRPDAPAKMLEAPGGMPGDVAVVVNEDDPAIRKYFDAAKGWPAWRLIVAPRGSRFCEAVRYAFEQFRGDNYFGIIDDDYWPVTPGWHDKMVKAAGGTGVAIANNRQNFPKPYTCRVMGGALARAIGTIAPGKMRHNFSDDAWERFALDFNVYHPLEDVIVEHHHHLFGNAEKDATYARGSSDLEEDRKLYLEWLSSDERRAQVERVAKLFGGHASVFDPKDVKLVVACPTHHSIDPIYHHSICRLQVECMRAGLCFGEIASYGGSHIGKARERVLWDAWKQDPTHILFVDDDMGFDPKLVFRLLAADLEFACAVGVTKTDKPKLCCNFYPGEQTIHPVTKFVKIRDVGLAFVLLKRTVIEKLVAAYPDLAYNAGPGKTEHALFLDVIENRERLSEDYSFCRRWTAIGGEIWADRHASLIHAGRKEYSGSINELFQGREAVNLNVEHA